MNGSRAISLTLLSGLWVGVVGSTSCEKSRAPEEREAIAAAREREQAAKAAFADRFQQVGVRLPPGHAPNEPPRLANHIVAEKGTPAVDPPGRLAEHVGFETPGGAFQPVLLAQSPVPAMKTEVFSTRQDNQRTLEVALYRGFSALVSENVSIGTVAVGPIPDGPRGVPQVVLTLAVVGDQIRVAARMRGTEAPLSVELK